MEGCSILLGNSLDVKAKMILSDRGGRYVKVLHFGIKKSLNYTLCRTYLDPCGHPSNLNLYTFYSDLIVCYLDNDYFGMKRNGVYHAFNCKRFSLEFKKHVDNKIPDNEMVMGYIMIPFKRKKANSLLKKNLDNSKVIVNRESLLVFTIMGILVW